MTTPRRPLTDYERALLFRDTAKSQYNVETRLTWQGFLNWVSGISSDMARIARDIERTTSNLSTMTTSITDFLNNLLSRLPRRS